MKLTRIFLILLLLATGFNLFLWAHWSFSNHEIWRGDLFYPWVLQDDFGEWTNYRTAINPLFLSCFLIALVTGVTLLIRKPRYIRWFFPASFLLLQLIFVAAYVLIKWPFFTG